MKGAPASQVEYSVLSLINAVQWGDLAHVESAIDGFGFSPNSCDADGCSLMHWATINNRFEIVKYLIHKNADINKVGGSNSENPLQWAFRSRNCAPQVQLLVAEEADIHHKSSYGCDALFVAVQCNKLNGAFLVLNSGGDPNTVDNNGDTPLYWLLRRHCGAPNREYLDMLRLLIRFKASVVTVSKDGCNALHILAGYSGANLDMASAHLVYEAGDHTMLETKNAAGRTPYDVAVASKNSEMVRFLYDAYLYKTLPYWAPMATAAASFCSLFVCLHLLGWLYGIVAYVVVFLLAESVSQSYIVRGESRAPCGMAWAIIVSAISCYYLLFSRYFSLYVDVLGVLFSIAIFYTLSKTTVTSPHSLYGNSADSRNRLGDKIVQTELEGEQLKFCTTCLVDRSQVSMHCSKCDRCVVSLDHHCPFVCNCVGRGNRLVFVLFTLSASTGCAVFTALSLFVQHTHYCPHATSELGRILAVQHCVLLNYPAISALTWVTACASLWIAAIFWGQVGLVSSETTTFEAMKRKPNGVDGCSWRGARNVVNFFLTGAYAVSSAPVQGGGSGPEACGGHQSHLSAALPVRPSSPHALGSSSNNSTSVSSSARVGSFLSGSVAGGYNLAEHSV